MTLKELERFFIQERDWVEDRILTVAKRSNYPVIYSNPEDCLDIFGELWLILSKPKTLNKLRNFSDIKGKINNSCYILLTKKGSSYIRGKNFSNNKCDGYIKVKDITAEEDEINEYESKLLYIDTIIERYRKEANKFDSILFDLYYQRRINSYGKLARHLQISEYFAGGLIIRLKTILEDMIDNDCSYEESKNKLKNMSTYKKNRMGFLTKVDEDCDCKDCEKCKEVKEEVVEDEVSETIIEPIIDEQLENDVKIHLDDEDETEDDY